MADSVTIEGIPELIGLLEQKISSIEEVSTKAIIEISTQLADTMIKYSKAGHPEHPNVQTGNMSGKSISWKGVEQSGSQISTKTGSDAEYAPFVEYGTSHSKAYPFVRPAKLDIFDSGKAVKIFKDELGGILNA
jgi:HK97 gp10 family phage protein